MMVKLSSKMGFHHENSFLYYPWENGQVEDVNKFLKTMIQWMVGTHKSNYHLLLFLALWAYQTSIKNATGFTPFQMVCDLEGVLPIECKILSLQLAIDLFLNTSSKEE